MHGCGGTTCNTDGGMGMIDFTDCKGLVNSYEEADFKRRQRMDGKIEYRGKKTPQNQICGVLLVTHVKTTYVG